MSTFTESQLKQLAWWPKVTGTLSFIGSGAIIQSILRDKKKRCGSSYHELLLALSISDLPHSFWCFMSTWPMPEGTPNVWNPSGTQASCTAQGFFIHLGIATPIYNTMLSIYFLLTIRYTWNETRLRKCARWVFHGVPCVWAVGTALAGLGLELYNAANLWCWISPFPPDCEGSRRNDGVDDCERGDNAWIYQWAFFYAPLWFCIVVSMVCMYLTYDAVRKIERASNKYRYVTSREEQNKQSHRVMVQAFLYVASFWLSWTPATLTRLFQTITLDVNFALLLLFAIFTPLQGFLNYIVYQRRKLKRYWNESIHSIWDRIKSYQTNDPTETAANEESAPEHLDSNGCGEEKEEEKGPDAS